MKTIRDRNQVMEKLIRLRLDSYRLLQKASTDETTKSRMTGVVIALEGLLGDVERLNASWEGDRWNPTNN